MTGCQTPDFLTPSDLEFQPLVLSATDRLMVLAPHPDDESLATGGLIRQALDSGIPVKIVFLTNGDNNELAFMLYRKRPGLTPAALLHMGEVRHTEALRAADVLGLTPDDLVFLGYPDFGTLRIWERHWGADTPAFRSMLTRVRAVSYESAYRPGAPYRGEEILRDLEDLLKDFKPTIVMVSHPADFNPDHRALYAFTRVALWNLQPEIQPLIMPYLVHFKKWPMPRRYRPEKTMLPPPDLAEPIVWYNFELNAEQIRVKRKALQSHATQYAYSAGFMDAFVRANEIFGDMPSVRLARIPYASERSLGEDVTEDEVPEGATARECAEFIGIERSFVALAGDNLIFTLDFRRPLAGVVRASLNCCGYRADTPFEKMPKLQVRVGATRYEVSDRGRILPAVTVNVERRMRRLVVKIPLSALGDPERILVEARTGVDEMPLDWLAWRVLELEY